METNNGESSSIKKFFRFIFFGGINTAATYGIYILLSQLIHYQTAYLVAYVSGIALAYLLNLLFVFNTRSSTKKALTYPIIYIVQYLLGALLMYLFLGKLNLSNAVAPLIVAVLLLPVSYYMNKRVLTG